MINLSTITSFLITASWNIEMKTTDTLSEGNFLDAYEQQLAFRIRLWDKSDDQQHSLHYSMTLKVYGAKIYGFIVQPKNIFSSLSSFFVAFTFLKQIFMIQHCYNSHHELFDIYRSNSISLRHKEIYVCMYWMYINIYIWHHKNHALK